MRVIAGSAKGTRLFAPAGEKTRPTTDRAKQKLFDTLYSLGARPEIILDLFAGSGALGIEALSRGATHAVFVEKNRSTVDVIRRNLEKTYLSQKSKTVVKDAFLYLKKEKSVKFDVIFADPPYQSGCIQKLISLITSSEILNVNGLLILEENSAAELKITGNLTLVQTKISGCTAHFILQKNE